MPTAFYAGVVPVPMYKVADLGDPRWFISDQSIDEVFLWFDTAPIGTLANTLSGSAIMKRFNPITEQIQTININSSASFAFPQHWTAPQLYGGRLIACLSQNDNIQFLDQPLKPISSGDYSLTNLPFQIRQYKPGTLSNSSQPWMNSCLSPIGVLNCAIYDVQGLSGLELAIYGRGLQGWGYTVNPLLVPMNPAVLYFGSIYTLWDMQTGWNWTVTNKAGVDTNMYVCKWKFDSFSAPIFSQVIFDYFDAVQMFSGGPQAGLNEYPRPSLFGWTQALSLAEANGNLNSLYISKDMSAYVQLQLAPTTNAPVPFFPPHITTGGVLLALDHNGALWSSRQSIFPNFPFDYYHIVTNSIPLPNWACCK